MRIRVLVFVLLLVLVAGCTHITPAGASGPDVLLSFPDRLKAGEQVVAFELDIRNGKILAVNKVPYDWLVNTLVQAPQSEMSGTPNHGASAFQDMTPLKRFLTVHKDGQAFDVTGSLVVITNFTDMKTNSFKKSDFILEQIAPDTALEPMATAP